MSLFNKVCSILIMVLSIISCTSVNKNYSSTEKELKLHESYSKYFLIGTAINDSQFERKDIRSLELIKKHFNSITPENVLKWEVVHPEPGVYNFEFGDKFVNFGIDENLQLIGHTLVWHAQTPDWVFEDDKGDLVNRETLLERMKDHISHVAGRYKNKIAGWDVVNEAITDDGKLRETKWKKIIGEDYVKKAFEYAKEATPDAELYYNDYNMWKPAKRDAVIKIIKELLDEGIQVDVIGLQGHWGLDYPDLDELKAALSAYSNLGLKVMVTELDIDVLPKTWDFTGAEISQNVELQDSLNPYPEVLPDSMHQKLANRYKDFFSIFLDYKESISRVTFWGVHDGVSWKNDWPVKGRTAYPLLFDRNGKCKPAFDAVIDIVKNK